MKMALKVWGLSDLEAKLETLEKASPAVAKMCLYEGAKVVADNLRAAVAKIPTEEHHAVPNAINGRQIVYLTPEEKAACLETIGIAKFQGEIDNFSTAVGFNGYQEDASSRRHPWGIPTPMIMASLEMGTSVRQKYPICRKTFKASESAAVAAMQAKFDEVMENIMK